MTDRPLVAGKAGARVLAPLPATSLSGIAGAARKIVQRLEGGSWRCTRTRERGARAARARLSRRYKPDNIHPRHRVNAGQGFFGTFLHRTTDEDRNLQRQ